MVSGTKWNNQRQSKKYTPQPKQNKKRKRREKPRVTSEPKKKSLGLKMKIINQDKGFKREDAHIFRLINTKKKEKPIKYLKPAPSFLLAKKKNPARVEKKIRNKNIILAKAEKNNTEA